MKILIYGSRGWIGAQFLSFIRDKTNHEIIEGNFRLENIKGIENEILELQPTNVIGFTGRTHGKVGDKVFSTIDYLEQEGKLVDNIRDNLFGPINMSLVCKKLGVHYTYLGTGCIFEYDNQHPYGEEVNGFTEESKPNFIGSSYSIVKGFTDQLLHSFEDSVLNLRTQPELELDLV